MSAQHKRPGRTARRRRQERALVIFYERPHGPFDERELREVVALEARTSQPLLPVPAKQARRLTR